MKDKSCTYMKRELKYTTNNETSSGVEVKIDGKLFSFDETKRFDQFGITPHRRT